MGYGITDNDAEDTGKATGWSIGNVYQFFNTTTSAWETVSDTSMRIAIKGYAAGGVTLSTDATLNALSVTGGGSELITAFVSERYAHTVSVANSVDEVTVTLTTTDSDATFEYLDSSDATLADADTNTAGHQVDLDVGDTVFKVKVTAEDGTTTQTYTVTVTRAACVLETDDIWCGVVTVGDVTNNDGDTIRHGFVGTTGGLSDEAFSLMFETGTTNNYTISAIVVGATTDTSEQLFFVTSSSLTDTEEESLALHVDGESVPFVFSDTSQLIAGSYRWPARTDLDWSSETTVTLRLREFPRPTVTNVEVTSTPALETDTYGAGETIEVSVTFSEAVNATSDTDFVLSVAGAKRAPLLRGSDTATLVFGYAVQATDSDTNGIWIGNETRTLDGNRGGEAQTGTITSVATGAAANLDHAELGTDSDHKVDGSRTTENVAPSFSSSATISVAENQTTVVTVLATDSDTDDSVTGYALTGGADQGFFSIVATSGALTFDAAPNYEDAEDQGNNNTYVVEVTATSGTGTRVMTADQTITVTVTDVDTEAPGKPGTPTVSAGSATSLRVNWSAPSNAGPPITGYDVRHRTSSPEGSWTEKNVPSNAAVIESLLENTSYDVQVRATNAEGTGAWSDSGNGTTDAAAVLPTLSVGNASATEGADISFPLTLSAAASAAVTVTCTASIESGDTAVAADLETTTGTASIGIGATSGPCFIETVQDTIDEDDETFTVTLSGVSSNAQLAADPTAKGTINDNDDPPTLSVGDVSAEEGTALIFTVALSAESGKTVTVDYATSVETDDTATSGTDFTAKTSTLTFDPGQEEKVFTVLTTEDAVDENDETFTVTLSSPSNATLSTTDATAKGTIEDDDGTSRPTLSVENASATEGSRISFPLTLTAAASAAVTVNCTASFETDDTATAEDLSPITTGTATIGAGTTSGTCSILSEQDTINEEDETFTVTLSGASSNAQLAADPTAKGTILDDDDPVDDCPADATTTCGVDVGGSTKGNIETAGDRDWFKVVLEAGTRYQIDVEGDDTGRGTVGNPDAILYNASSTRVSSNDDEGVGENARLIYTPTAAGAHYVLVSEATTGQEGTYTVSVIVLGANGASEADTDFPATTSTTGWVEVGASATGTIGADNDDDWFRVDLEAGKTYQFDMEGMDTGRGTQPDPYVELTNSSGNRELGFDNNAGVDNNARLIYTADATGTHYVVAATGSDEQGTYTLSVRDVTPPDDLPANTSTTGTVEVGGSAVRGDIYEPKWVEGEGENEVDGWDFDTDWFAVELEADKTYRIDMKGQILSSPGLGIPGEPVDPELTLSLPQINAIYNEDGEFLVNTRSRDESSAHHLFRVTFHAHDDGTYYIAASGESHEGGGYELTVIDITPDDGDDTNPPAGEPTRRGSKTCVRSRRRPGLG